LNSAFSLAKNYFDTKHKKSPEKSGLSYKGSSNNYFLSRNKDNEKDARHKFLLIAVAI